MCVSGREYHIHEYITCVFQNVGSHRRLPCGLYKSNLNLSLSRTRNLINSVFDVAGDPVVAANVRDALIQMVDKASESELIIGHSHAASD